MYCNVPFLSSIKIYIRAASILSVCLPPLTQLTEIGYLFNGVLFAGRLSHTGYLIHMVLQAQLQAAGEGQVGFGLDVYLNVIGEHLPVAAPHPWVPQALYQGDVGTEVLNLAPDISCHHLAV